jgi:putative PEP-CTERM system TPR-repeat lipoprotein
MVMGVALLNGGLVACSKMQSSEALVSEAKEYLRKGDNKAAVIQLKNALQKNPDDAEARYLLGNIYNDIGDPLSAEKELRKALSLGVNRDKVTLNLGKALLMQGQYQKVLDETSQVAATKSDAELSTLRGNAYLALGKLADAKASFDRALKDKADFPDALIGLAKHELAQNDIATATGFSEQAVTANPTNPNTWLFKGDLLRVQGKVEHALAAYDQVLKLKPGDARAHIVKATLEIQAKHFDSAKMDIDAARKSTPNAPIVFYTQALFDYAQGKHAAAWESIQQVLRIAPDHMPSVLLAGVVQLSLGSSQQAEQHLKKYLEKNPGDLYASKILASVLLKNEQTDRAITLVNTALKDAPEDPQLLALAGESYMKAKEFGKATKYFEKASTLVPAAAPLRTALAQSSLAQGQDTRAIAELERAISLDAKSTQAGILLIMTHVRRKEYDKALAATNALEKEHPDNPLIQTLKGGIFVDKKNIPAARVSFEKALTLQPTYYPAAAALAQLDLQEKKPDAAKKRFEAVLEKDKKSHQAMSALAGIAEAQGKKQEATDWLERANRENPDEVQPALLLAAQYLRFGDTGKALTFLQKLRVAQPSNPEVLDLLAQTQLANKDPAAALDSYKKLAAVMPTSGAPHLRIASIYIAMQNYAAATDAVKKALSLQPDYLEAQLADLALHVRAGRHEQALAIARHIQMQRNKSAVGYVAEGDVLMSQNKPAVAIKAYDQAFALNKSGQVLMKVYDSLSRAGKYQEADARINQWLKEQPNDTPTRMHLATESLKNQRNKTAIEQFQIVLQQDPKNVIAMNNLALALQQEKDPRALEYAEKAIVLAPDNAGVLDTVGWLLVEQGNITRGLPLLQKAASLAPEFADIRYHLAHALIKSGDKVGARKELEGLLASGKPFSKADEARTLLKQLQ